MSDTPLNNASRRNFVKQTGSLAAASTALAAGMRTVHAAQNNTIQVALVGAGGRGTGATEQALSVPNEQVKLVAMADAGPAASGLLLTTVGQGKSPRAAKNSTTVAGSSSMLTPITSKPCSWYFS